MAEDMAFDLKTWQIVRDFFRPGVRKRPAAGALSAIGQAFSGLACLATGFLAGGVPPSAGFAAMAAGGGGPFGLPDGVDDGDERGRQVFSWHADVSPDSRDFWRASAHVALDLAEGENEKIVISVRDGRQRRIEKGVLELLGSRLPVENGLAEYSLKEFWNALTNTERVCLLFPDGRRVNGLWAFFTPTPEREK